MKTSKHITNLNKAIIKMFILLTFLLCSTLIFGQNSESKTINLLGVEWLQENESFNNVFELNEKRVKPVLNYGQFNHVFKTKHTYNNVIIVKIVNSSYFNAENTKQYIKSINKDYKIKFIR